MGGGGKGESAVIVTLLYYIEVIDYYSKDLLPTPPPPQIINLAPRPAHFKGTVLPIEIRRGFGRAHTRSSIPLSLRVPID